LQPVTTNNRHILYPIYHRVIHRPHIPPLFPYTTLFRSWFAATRVTEKPLVRAFVALGWMLAPPFLTAIVEGRPTGLLVHLLLPWLLFAGAVAHRSWTSAAVASLLLAAVVACSPSLAPALVVLWLVAIVLTAAR